MNQEPNPLLSEPTSRGGSGKKWLKIAGYICLLLLVAWLYSLPPGDGKQADQRDPNKQTPVSGTELRDGGQPPREARAKQRTSRSGPASRDDAEEEPTRSDTASVRADGDRSVIVRNARVTNEDGRVIYRGDIDLTRTLDRIERGERLRFSHDGVVFENREKRLPIHASGYYHEFVHPTPDERGPGGQRVVVGRKGEVYYTPDHYHTFRRVR